MLNLSLTISNKMLRTLIIDDEGPERESLQVFCKANVFNIRSIRKE